MLTKHHKNHITVKQARALAIVLGVGLAITLLLQGFISFVIEKQPLPSFPKQEKENIEREINPFENISLEARAAYVADLKTGEVLYAKNENEKLPLASITKLMTTLVARERMSGSVVVTLTKDDLKAEGDSGLRPGERWRLDDILNAMLLISSNDAAHAVAGFVGADGHPEKFLDMSVARAQFVQMMNEKAVALGLAEMQFFNESGLDVSDTQNGGYGSARNVAMLFEELWGKYPEVIEVTAHKDARIYSQDNIAHILPNTNEIVGHIPGLVASKTGFTELSGGNLTVIFDRGIGDPVVIVVLGSGYKERFDDVQKLVKAATTPTLAQK
ncbi:MAG: serine hydrolase [Candidatus Pacebacteria bacterium]|jgi:D-alanyl-D-alanine carboxypeptidase|nr:serine hydrolase [Candidatus Paceibacterota bacterium]